MKKKVSWLLGIILGLLILGVGGYASYIYSSVKDTAQKMYEPIDTKSIAPSPLKKSAVKPISILFYINRMP